MLLGALAVGCTAHSPATTPVQPPGASTTNHASLTDPRWLADVRAYCPPPAGWRDAAVTPRAHSEQRLWISPTGATAYGVIAIRHLLLPLASDERVLGEFLKEMKASEGAADLLEKRYDPALACGIGGLRFIARGGRYVVHGTLVSSGTDVWIVYAGTETRQPVREEELKVAEWARERTIIEPAARR